ncbi:MAG: cell division protein ZapB [Desulfuromonadales bacterium]|nr:cell division protein ZapB [Desulfuromonadales bacterium]MDW7758662.1 cell division protein ZapB [Desulfuromonadales bacterium]
MDLDVVFRLEEKLDDLLKQHHDLLDDCRRLRAEKEAFLKERDRVRSELDRILEKLDRVDREIS